MVEHSQGEVACLCESSKPFTLLGAVAASDSRVSRLRSLKTHARLLSILHIQPCAYVDSDCRCTAAGQSPRWQYTCMQAHLGPTRCLQRKPPPARTPADPKLACTFSLSLCKQCLLPRVLTQALPDMRILRSWTKLQAAVLALKAAWSCK